MLATSARSLATSARRAPSPGEMQRRYRGDVREISARYLQARYDARRAHSPGCSARPLYLPCISPVSPVHLPYISPISRLAARHGPPRWRPAWSCADSEHLVRVGVRVRVRVRAIRALRAPPGLLGLGLASASSLGAASGAGAMGSSTRTPTAAKVASSSWSALGFAIQLEG